MKLSYPPQKIERMEEINIYPVTEVPLHAPQELFPVNDFVFTLLQLAETKWKIDK